MSQPAVGVVLELGWEKKAHTEVRKGVTTGGGSGVVLACRVMVRICRKRY